MLARWVEDSSLKNWTSCKNELERVKFLAKVDKSVNQHCPEWLEILQKKYPRRQIWDVLLQNNL